MKTFEEKRDEAATAVALKEVGLFEKGMAFGSFILGAGWARAETLREVEPLIEALTKIKDVLDEYGIAPTEIMLLSEATKALEQWEKMK